MYDKEFLNSWKEVAQYVGRSERTIQRWEREFGLPVHRPAGRLRSSVIAVAAEIDEWIMNSPASRSKLEPFSPAAPGGPSTKAGRRPRQ
jgi:predicted DNA-binding transcriptional regulator AlpA